MPYFVQYRYLGSLLVGLRVENCLRGKLEAGRVAGMPT